MKMALFLLVATLAWAGSAPASGVAFEDIQHAVEIYNMGVESAPEVVKTLLGDERVQIEVSGEEGPSLLAGLETRRAVVVNITEGEIPDPTILVEATEDAIQRVFLSPDPAGAFQEARDQGDIKITGTTWSAKAKVAAALASSSALQFFAGLIGG